jgi:hypothetical protein
MYGARFRTEPKHLVYKLVTRRAVPNGLDGIATKVAQSADSLERERGPGHKLSLKKCLPTAVNAAQ